MGLHLIGEKCPACKKKGLVVGALNPLTGEQIFFRPHGWIFDKLEAHRAVCPKCGFIVMALAGKALERLQQVLHEERRSEAVTYHSKSKARARRRKPPGPSEPGTS